VDVKFQIVEAAGEQFARHGYQTATIAKICNAAKTNIASVNYHLGGKEALFLQVIRHSFAQAEELNPISGGLPDDAPAKTRFRAFIDAFLRRTFNPNKGGQIYHIMCRVITDPKAPQDKIRKEMETLEIFRLEAIVRDLISKEPSTKTSSQSTPLDMQAASKADQPSESDLLLLVSHVMSLCVFFIFATPVRSKCFPNNGCPGEAELDALIHQIYRFDLAGLQEVTT